MSALLVVIFLDNFLKEKQHFSSVVGVVSSLVCLLVLGSDGFILPSMAAILIILTVLRKPIERAYDGKESERK